MLLRLGRFLRMAGRDLVVLWYACRNPAAPRALKLAALLLALYVMSPLDVLPDWFAVLGWIDDITLLALAVPALLNLMPEPVLAQAHGTAARWRFRKPWSLG